MVNGAVCVLGVGTKDGWTNSTQTHNMHSNWMEGENLNMLKQHFQNSIFNFVSKLLLMPWEQLIFTKIEWPQYTLTCGASAIANATSFQGKKEKPSFQ